MSYGIKLVSWADGRPYVGKRSGGPEWLMWFDPDIHDPMNKSKHPYPTGDGDSTPNPNEAMSFESMSEAWDFWRQVSKITPTRPDGSPNRPLTVFSIEVAELK